MKRRAMCQSPAAAALLCGPLGALAQAKRSARVGVLSTQPRQAPGGRALFARLKELGWSEGFFGSGNLSVDYRQVEPGAGDVAAVVAALASAKCELILATATALAVAAKAAAPSVPLVFIVGGDPVDFGLVASMAKPGRNATGLTWAPHEWGTSLVDLLKELAPRAKRIGVIYGAAYEDVDLKIFALLKAHAAAEGIALQALPVRTREDVHALDPVWTRAPIDGVIVFFDPTTVALMGEIVRLAALQRVPAVYASRYFIDVGGLLSYGIDWPAEVARAADYVASILDGARPADLPVERAKHFEMLVNLRAARSLGISAPPTVLARATEVIQ